MKYKVWTKILYPITIKRIEPCDFKIIHYGFSNYKQLMKHIGVHSANKQKLVDTGSGAIYVKLAKEGAKWAEAYVKNGKGVPNMFINEENLIVEKVPLEWFPKENIPINVYLKPNPFPISELKVYSDIKENILFLGNCQIKVITRFCSHYINKKIEYLNIVYDLKDKSPRVDHLIKNADIIVTQPFTSGRWYYDHKKINELRNNNSYLLVVHCLYYDGYFPYMNIDNYKDKEQNDKLKNEIIKNSETSFKNLYERENGINNYIKIDIPIYNFIKENYKNKRLFLRENHPTDFLMNKYSYLIYKKIWNDNVYFQSNKLNIYNEKFEKKNTLNAPETYLEIDSFTKKTLELEF